MAQTHMPPKSSEDKEAKEQNITRRAGKSISELVFVPEVEELHLTLSSLFMAACFLFMNRGSRNKFKRHDSSK